MLFKKTYNLGQTSLKKVLSLMNKKMMIIFLFYFFYHIMWFLDESTLYSISFCFVYVFRFSRIFFFFCILYLEGTVWIPWIQGRMRQEWRLWVEVKAGARERKVECNHWHGHGQSGDYYEAEGSRSRWKERIS